MLLGVYKLDREATKNYLRRYGVEPPDDGFSKRLRDASPLIRALLAPDAPGRELSRAGPRLAFDSDGAWRLLHHDLQREDWVEWASGEWRQAGSSLQLTLQRLDGRTAQGARPLSLEVEADRLLFERSFAGSLYGLIGFRHVPALEE